MNAPLTLVYSPTLARIASIEQFAYCNGVQLLKGIGPSAA